jgi:hypothetical protein
MENWFIVCAAVVMSTGFCTDICKNETPCKPPSKKAKDLPYDADLFRKDAQVYSGHAEVLAWAVSEGSLDYALKMRHASWGSLNYAQGRMETGTYDVDPGFRVALSYFRAPHYWEIKWQYTRLTSCGDNSVNAPAAEGQYLTGTWPQILANPLTKATSHLHLNYNVFDWIVTRVFFPNPHLRMRVLGGAFAAWMDQDWKVRYYDDTNNSTTIRNRWHFVGGGLKAGSTVDWYWTGDLYMTGLASFGGLIGSYSNHSQQKTTYQPNPSDNPNIPLRDLSLNDTRGVFTTQVILGPSWQKNFTNSRVEAFVGFESNLWFNLQEIYRSTGSDSAFDAKETWMNSGLLALYGLTARLTVDF